MRYATSIPVGLLLVACTGCKANLPIDGAAQSSTSGDEQGGEHSGTTGGTPTSSGSDTTGDGTTGDGMTGDGTTGAAACVPPTGAPGELLAAVPVTGNGNQHVRAVAIDDNGDTYIAGFFGQDLALQDEEIKDELGLTAAYVARLDCAGELVWLKAARAGDVNSSSQGHTIALHDGRVYLGGEVVGGVQFTDGAALMGGTGKAFIAGFDVADGTPTDVAEFDEETTAVRSLVIDGEGKIYAVGGCQDGLTGVLVATWSTTGEPPAYACKYTLAAGTDVTTALGVALTADDGLVLGGQLSAAIMDWPDPVVESGSSRGFIARLELPLDLTGPVVPAWMATVGGDNFKQNRVDAVTLRGDEIVAAARGSGLTRLRGTSDVDCGVDCPPNMGFAVHNTAVVRLGPDGSCIDESVLCSDTSASEEIWGIAATADRTYLTGQFQGSLLLGGQDLTTAPQPAGVRTFVMNLDAEVAQDANGWVLLSDDADTECGFVPDATTETLDPRSIMRGAAVAVGPDGVVVAGSVCGPGLSLGGAPFMPGPQSFDGFVVKLAR